MARTDRFNCAKRNQNDQIWRSYYSNVKERLFPGDGSSYGYHFTDEDFYIYMTVHEYKHYCEGGSGLRFLLDDYVFLKAKESSLDWDYVDGELNKLGAYDFGKKTRILSQKLFNGSFPKEVTRRFSFGIFISLRIYAEWEKAKEKP